MSRVCELTGKGVMTGNNVSHAKNRTRRRFLPNLNDVTIASEVLGRSFKFRVAASTLRTIDTVVAWTHSWLKQKTLIFRLLL